MLKRVLHLSRTPGMVTCIQITQEFYEQSNIRMQISDFTFPAMFIVDPKHLKT